MQIYTLHLLIESRKNIYYVMSRNRYRIFDTNWNIFGMILCYYL